MILSQIEIRNFRNLTETTLHPVSHINLLTGVNGSGKSSILEAIHCLSVGHSFRTRKIRELIAHNYEEFTLASQMDDPRNARTHRCGLRRDRSGSTELRLDYKEIHSFSPVTQLLPVKALTPDSHALIQHGPGGRRQFLDWGSFHMEPGFLPVWKQYRRALSQRNQALRDQLPDKEIVSWDEQLAEAGEQLGNFRKTYTARLNTEAAALLTAMSTAFPVKLTYRCGWSSELSLTSALQQNLANCRRFRTTTTGPHRADLLIETNDHLARQVLSRGQQKVLVYVLHLAQLITLHRQTENRAVILCDDLTSELDEFHQHQIIQQLVALDCQVFFTGTAVSGELLGDHAEFHVNHGSVEKTV